MPRKPGSKFGRAAAHGPDDADLLALVEAFRVEYDADLTYEVHSTVEGSLIVACSTEVTDVDGNWKILDAARLWSPNGRPLIALMLQCAHELWHVIDRDETLAYKAKLRRL